MKGKNCKERFYKLFCEQNKYLLILNISKVLFIKRNWKEKMIKVLFVCIHNSARSQVAEALLKYHGSEIFEVESAGLEPGILNPLAVKAMQEMGVDISKNVTNSVFDFLNEDKSYNYVITVCDESQSKRCPIFPGKNEKLHWSFQDPSSLTGSPEENLKRTIEIRDEIKSKIRKFISEVSNLNI